MHSIRHNSTGFEGWLVKCRDFILERLTSLDIINNFKKKDTGFMAHCIFFILILQNLWSAPLLCLVKITSPLDFSANKPLFHRYHILFRFIGWWWLNFHWNYWFTALKVDILLHKGTNKTLKWFDQLRKAVGIYRKQNSAYNFWDFGGYAPNINFWPQIPFNLMLINVSIKTQRHWTDCCQLCHCTDICTTMSNTDLLRQQVNYQWQGYRWLGY